MKKKLWIIVVIVVIICSSLLIINKIDHKDKKNYSNKDFENKVNVLNKKIISGMDKKDYKKFTGEEFIAQDILIGDESFLKEKLSEALRKKVNISNYETKMYEYANNVEKMIKDNFESNVIETLTSGEGDTIVKLTYKPYYYTLYLYDLENLISNLLEFAGYSKDIPDKDADKGMIDYYKAKIKAMEIMDDHLENYRNDYEYFDQDIIFKKGNLDAVNPYIESYLLTISGSLSKNINFTDTNYLSKRKKIVDSYINNAIQNGTLNKKDPLKLK